MAMSDDKWEAFLAEQERRRQKEAAELAEILRVLDVSPAVEGQIAGIGPVIAIVSGEISDLASGSMRVTFFGEDGPRGHYTRGTVAQIADEIRDTIRPPYRPLTEDDVIAFTSTDRFVRGSQEIALNQAESTLRYLAQQRSAKNWANERINDARFVLKRTNSPEAALEVLHAAIRELPVANPRIAGFMPNPPPWVTRVLADTYEDVEIKVPPAWIPQLRDVDADRKGITAAFLEYGCGNYGCVMATLDPTTVLKITSDDTEAQFAIKHAQTLVADICVEYRMAMRVSIQHQGRPVYLLWREAAEHVGKIDEVLDVGYLAEVMIGRQHKAAQVAYDALYKGAPPQYVADEINAWVETCKFMARQNQVPELKPLGAGLVQVWEEQRILFGDIHAGNLGLVNRDGAERWVITDPGNVAVVR